MLAAVWVPCVACHGAADAIARQLFQQGGHCGQREGVRIKHTAMQLASFGSCNTNPGSHVRCAAPERPKLAVMAAFVYEGELRCHHSKAAGLLTPHTEFVNKMPTGQFTTHSTLQGMCAIMLPPPAFAEPARSTNEGENTGAQRTVVE